MKKSVKNFFYTVYCWGMAIGYLLLLFGVGWTRIALNALSESARRRRQRWFQFYPKPNHGKFYTGPDLEMDADGFVPPPEERQQPRLKVVGGNNVVATPVLSIAPPPSSQQRNAPPVLSVVASPASQQRSAPPVLSVVPAPKPPTTHRSQPVWPATRVPPAPPAKPRPAATVLQFPPSDDRAARLRSKLALAADKGEQNSGSQTQGPND